jgi:hypothetical protein
MVYLDEAITIQIWLHLVQTISYNSAKGAMTNTGIVGLDAYELG